MHCGVVMRGAMAAYLGWLTLLLLVVCSVSVVAPSTRPSDGKFSWHVGLLRGRGMCDLQVE